MTPYEAFFDHLKRARTYGVVEFTLRDGEVKRIEIKQGFLNIEQALAHNSSLNEDEPGGEEYGGQFPPQRH
jgi:hypothetical protein